LEAEAVETEAIGAEAVDEIAASTSLSMMESEVRAIMLKSLRY